MPKTKKIEIEKEVDTKSIPIIDDEEKIADTDLIAGDVILDEEEEDEEASQLDADEVDPFKDKWEE